MPRLNHTGARLAAVLALLSVVSCSKETAPKIASTLPERDSALDARPSEVYSLGRSDGADTETFVHVSAMAFDADDNLYVLDGGSKRVMVYDRGGKFTRQIGKPGNGPGELTAPMQIALTREGQVVVSDLRRRGFSVFQRDGSFVRTIPFAEGRGVAGLELRAHPRNGFVTAYQPVPGRDASSKGVEIAHAGLQDDSFTTLFRVPPGSGSAGMVDPRQPAFTPRVQWGVLPDGQAVVSYTAEYALQLAGPDGKAARELRRPIDPRKVTAADRQLEREKRMESLEHEGAALSPAIRNTVRKMVEELRFAPVMPVIRNLMVDPAGYVWVERGAPNEKGPGRIDLITPAGVYAGTLEGQDLPQAISASGRAAYLERDDLDVEKVVVRQIPASWRKPAP